MLKQLLVLLFMLSLCAGEYRGKSQSGRRKVPASAISETKKVVCYYTNWSQYRQGKASFLPEDIDPFMCTHIVYAFAKLNDDHQLEEFEWNDPNTEWSVGMYERMMRNRVKNPKLKILLAVGGWNLGPTLFSEMVHNETIRQTFVETSLAFLKKNKFDGLDLDWEYPGSRDGSEEDDKQLFTILIKELKAAFKHSNLLLTAAVGVGMETVESGYEIDQISEHLDFINLMTYDLHGSWENFVGHNAPLKGREDDDEEQAALNLDFVVNHWLNNGAPKEKLILGLATYGRTFRLGKSNKNIPGSTAVGPGSPGKFSGEAGFLTYYEICTKLTKENWQYKFDEEQQVPYAFKKLEWVTFDDRKSLKLKTEFLKEYDLGGAMFWSLDSDDFKGAFCGQGKYPLIKSVLKILNSDEDSNPTEYDDDFKMTEADEDINAQEEVKDTKISLKNMDEEDIKTHCPKGDGFYANYESNCTEYRVCLFTKSEHANVQFLHCPDGLVFDVTLKACNFANLVKCKKKKEKKVNKNLCKDGDGFYLAENSNCGKYYLCAFSNTDEEMVTDFTCPPYTKFNKASSECESGFNCGHDKVDNHLNEFKFAKVKPQSNNVCADGDGYYADVQSKCKFFYECLFSKTKYARKTKKECPEGFYFNQKEAKCNSKLACV